MTELCAAGATPFFFFIWFYYLFIFCSCCSRWQSLTLFLTSSAVSFIFLRALILFILTLTSHSCRQKVEGKESLMMWRGERITRGGETRERRQDEGNKTNGKGNEAKGKGSGWRKYENSIRMSNKWLLSFLYRAPLSWRCGRFSTRKIQPLDAERKNHRKSDWFP